MDKPIVACIQHRLIVPKTADDYTAYLNRFLRTAKAKGAVLAVFPELSGLASGVITFSGWRNELLKTAGQGQHLRAGFWDRTKARMAGAAASVAQADLQKSLVGAVSSTPAALRDAYMAVFSGLARQHEMTIIAGSVYDQDPESGMLHNTSYVFGPDGSVLGKQAKVVISGRETVLAQPAGGWGIIPTPAGRVGILIGTDSLYPEPARILAYQGADMLVSLAAVTQPATYHKIRQASLARCQENQLYGLVSFLTGPDPFSPAEAPPFVGASAIYAPADFTQRFSGVMVEVGSPLAEAVVTAEWDYSALAELWQHSDTPLRRTMPLRQAGAILATVYGSGIPLAEAEQLRQSTSDQPALEDAGVVTVPVVEIGGDLEAPMPDPAADAVSPMAAGSVEDAEPAAVDDATAGVSEAVIEAQPTATLDLPPGPDDAPLAPDVGAVESAPEEVAEARRYRFPWQK